VDARGGSIARLEAGQELARAFSRTFQAVEARRCALDGQAGSRIQSRQGCRGGWSWKATGERGACQTGARYITWTEEEDALLGKFTDEEVARKLGYSCRGPPPAVVARVPNNNPNNRHWTKEEIALLGTRPDREVASWSTGRWQCA